MQRHVGAVDLLEADTPTVAAIGGVAAQHVAVDRHAAGTERDHASHRRLTDDDDAATVRGTGLLEALVEQDLVVRDRAVLAEADVADATAIGGAVVAAHPVVVDHVAIGAAADRDAAARAAGAGGGLDRSVLGDGVVMDLHVAVVAQAHHVVVRVGRQRCEFEVGHADAHAAVQRAGISEHAVVRDLEPVCPAVHIDAAAGVATGDAQSVYARCGAQEVAIRHGLAVSADRAARALRFGQVLREHGDARALFGAEHRRLEQHDAAGDLLRRQRVDLRDADLVAGGDVDREQAVDHRPPGFELRGRVLGCVDDDRGRTHALQAYRLPHHHELVVDARVDQDQVARVGRVDRRLDQATGRAVDPGRRNRAADRDGHGVDAGTTVSGRHDELTGFGAGRHGDGDRGVAPGGHGLCDTVDGHSALRRAETVVARDKTQARRASQRERAAVGRVEHLLVTERGDGQRVACTGGGNVGAETGAAVDACDRRGFFRVRAIGRVVAAGVRGDRQHRRVEVSRAPRHERQRVAKVAVGGGVLRVSHQLARGIEDRTGVVDAGHEHVGPVARRCGRVHEPARRGHQVVRAPLVGIVAADLAPIEVLNRDRHERHRGLLAEIGCGRVELGAGIVKDDAGSGGRHRHCGEHEEIDRHLHLVA